jgi:hypothetical protein
MAAKHRKRPRDPNQLGKFIIDVATGEIEDRPSTPKSKARSASTQAKHHQTQANCPQGRESSLGPAAEIVSRF